MASVREDLEAFAAELFDGFFRADQRRWGQAYVRGLLLDGCASRWSVTSSPWDPAHVRARLAWKMPDAMGVEALIVDDTGITATPRPVRCTLSQRLPRDAEAT